MRGHQAQGLLARTRARHEPASLGTEAVVIGLVSGKGGVGKSALAVNLAIAAGREGRRVLLIDGDVGLTNADLLLGLVPRFDLADWVEGRAALEDVLCGGPEGIDLLLAGRGAASHESLYSALQRGGRDPLGARLADYDLVFLDLGAGIGPRLIELACRCSRLWLVAVPEPTSLADAYAITKRITERAPALPIELLVNRVPDRATGERTHQALERLTRRFLSRGLPLRGTLPEDPAMARSVARQMPVVLGEPGSPVARRLDLLAQSLLEEGPAPPAPATASRATGDVVAS